MAEPGREVNYKLTEPIRLSRKISRNRRRIEVVNTLLEFNKKIPEGVANIIADTEAEVLSIEERNFIKNTLNNLKTKIIKNENLSNQNLETIDDLIDKNIISGVIETDEDSLITINRNISNIKLETPIRDSIIDLMTNMETFADMNDFMNDTARDRFNFILKDDFNKLKEMLD